MSRVPFAWVWSAICMCFNGDLAMFEFPSLFNDTAYLNK